MHPTINRLSRKVLRKILRRLLHFFELSIGEIFGISEGFLKYENQPLLNTYLKMY